MSRVQKRRKRQADKMTAVVANSNGEIIELPGYGAVGMAGALKFPLTVKNTRVLPYGSELMYLPARVPLIYNYQTDCIEALERHPHFPDQRIYPVAAFNSPGYVLQYTAAYEETPKAKLLPLFSYGALGWQNGGFRSAVIQVDQEPRQDLRKMPAKKIMAGIRRERRNLSQNRLRTHLENCALTYGCPAAKNFFLGRYEAPLPTSGSCNARCLGCISLQEKTDISSSQNRIAFSPTPKEIAAVALAHIKRVPQAVVSFGQGCEGDPLMAAKSISKAIYLIRKETNQGTINMNTNAGLPKVMETLFKAGLDSIRVSLNSVREDCYKAYFRPNGYQFSHVLESISKALNHNVHVAINYLNCPGFSDTDKEAAALFNFLRTYPIGQIQWRNLNFDPLRYVHSMNQVARHGRPLGMAVLLKKIQKEFPKVRFGYFNPPKEAFLKRSN
jgi:molybdenum cofactor biosynthesis enzyme MoaA